MTDPISTTLAVLLPAAGAFALAGWLSVGVLDWLIVRLCAHRAGLLAYREERQRVMEASR